MKAWKWNNWLKYSTSEIKACYLPQRLQEKTVTCRYDTKYRLTCNLHLLKFMLWPVTVWFCTTNIDVSGNVSACAKQQRHDWQIAQNQQAATRQDVSCTTHGVLTSSQLYYSEESTQTKLVNTAHTSMHTTKSSKNINKMQIHDTALTAGCWLEGYPAHK